MVIKFAFEQAQSPLLGTIWRPIAQVFFERRHTERWRAIWMIVDSGADYTLLPHFMAPLLGVNVEAECRVFQTTGIGGTEKVYFLPKMRVRLGNMFERQIPVGFLDRNEVPPLLGRHLFMETFETYFSTDHHLHFSDRPFQQEA